MKKKELDINAPLMLFPVKIECNAKKISIENDNSRDIIYNTTLILANNYYNKENLVLPDNALEEFNSEEFIKDMLSFYSKNNLIIEYKNSEIEEFFELTSDDFSKYKEGELEVKEQMVLGLYSTYVTSMYADFHKMLKENKTTEIIKKLFLGFSNTDFGDDIKIKEPCDIIENKIKYINELDFSQENVLKQIDETDSLVIQGPPGTGKSQTITSIIAQSVIYGKKILMVSEKKAALDVIYSRLGELSKFALMVDDIENKSEFFEQVKAIIDIIRNDKSNFEKIVTHNTVDINSNIEKIDKNINEKIDNFRKIATGIYYSTDFDVAIGELYNTCSKINFTDDKERNIYNFLETNINENINKLKYFELTKIKDKFSKEKEIEPILFYLKKIVNNNLIINIKDNLNDREIYMLKEQIDALEGKRNEYNSSIIKLFIKSKISKMASEIAENYFIKYDADIIKYISNIGIEDIKNVLANYENFKSSKFLYNDLADNEKEYVKIIFLISQKFDCSYEEANYKIYNFILYKYISNFEQNNSELIQYINNFDKTRGEIQEKIREKKEIVKELANILLYGSVINLNGLRNLQKIEEICNRSRKMSVNKFMSKYKFEMLDSIRIWFMTPEVVSDILPFEKNIFDLVIFDEASQLYVEKAIPAIYRAKKVVIAGDDKQLKPSRLGDRRIVDEEDYDDKYDGALSCESLLDAARYKFDYTMLEYHYRSKYEELIAFSNYAFYNGKLMVTSEANLSLDKPPIERIKVDDGCWIKEKNIQEAQRVVELIKEILDNRKNDETIGVITFNASQCDLIEDLIYKEKQNDDEFAKKMNIEEERKTKEGENINLFVKNIENVQGDERDIIIFCIGYAKDENGKVAVNFGWLNKEGGENRLNVAISRAKSKIYVVTSIEPEELNVESTKNRGPKLLRSYLEYVKAVSEKKNELAQSILLKVLNKKNNFDEKVCVNSRIEEEIFSKLNEKYEVEKQYGVGGYKIDFVVKSSDNYKNILGIESDNKLYHFSKYARERDYHRQKYLEMRGWKLHRIWSCKWWKNFDIEYKELEERIDKSKFLK